MRGRIIVAAPVMMTVIALIMTLVMALIAPLQARADSAAATNGRNAELDAAWEAAAKAARAGPAQVELIDQAVLTTHAGEYFVPRSEGGRVLRAMGNRDMDDTFQGLLVGVGDHGSWIVVVRFVKEGYIQDDDAKNWNADDLLSTLRSGTEEANKDRLSRGFPELEIVGWLAPPSYDAATHRLVWSILGRDKGAAGADVNYNTYALGREGYFSFNLLTSSDKLANHIPVVLGLLDNLSYSDGKRYSDFNASTDRIAEYGLAALVGGLVAKKLGLFALAAAGVLKFGKLFLLAALGLGAGFLQLIRRKPANPNVGEGA